MTKEEFISKNVVVFQGDVQDVVQSIVSSAWDAATEEVKKDHFKIGEEVEARIDDSSKWRKCIVVLSEDRIGFVRKNVRRIPAWEPKDGDVVFAKNRDGSASVAKCIGFSDSYVVIKLQNGATGRWMCEHLKPFDPEKIGKPWEEV